MPDTSLLISALLGVGMGLESPRGGGRRERVALGGQQGQECCSFNNRSRRGSGKRLRRDDPKEMKTDRKNLHHFHGLTPGVCASASRRPAGWQVLQ